MDVGKRIKEIRRYRGITQKELGHLLDLGDSGANRIAQYESGYRVPKDELLTRIAQILDVRVENFYASDRFLPDIMRTLMWYDYLHGDIIKLSNTELDSPEEIPSAPKLRGSASVTVYDVPMPATVMWIDNPIGNDFVCEWCTRKQELAKGVISKSEYFEWMIQWPSSSDMNGRREPPKQWRKGKVE